MTYIALTAKHHDLRKVRKRLRRRGLTAYVPCVAQKVFVTKGEKSGRRTRVATISNYIYVEAPANAAMLPLFIHSLTQTKGVIGRVDGLIPDDDVTYMRAYVDAMLFEMAAARQRAKKKTLLRRGDKARVTGGHFKEAVGKISWINKKALQLEAELNGRRQKIVVSRDSVEAA